MLRRGLLSLLFVVGFGLGAGAINSGSAEGANPGQPHDWNRFYYYPYVYYPHAFQRQQTYNHLYYKYPAAMRIPVQNMNWYNFYTTEKPYHRGHHFLLDVF